MIFTAKKPVGCVLTAIFKGKGSELLKSIQYHTVLTSAVTILWLVSSLLLPVIPPSRAAEEDWAFISTDVDGDGLPNIVEATGWCNAKGCFTTDPMDLDSDDDTLTDGEEKLFDSIPTGSAGATSPGLYVIYDNAFKTKEYYPWQPYGLKLIARADDFIPPRPDERGGKTNLDAIVVRRGTTFTVGGPTDKTLVIEKSTGGLTTLTPNRDPFTGEWRVSVPNNGTVGRYTLKLGSEQMDLLVIFELPKPSGELTQNGIDRFVYDDNPDITRDEAAILLGDDRFPPSSGAPYPLSGSNFVNEGTSYAFDTEHYVRYLLEDYVIDTINGKTSQTAAADALAEKVDALTVFRNPHPRFSSFSVLHPGSNPRQQCSNIAGLLAAFNRAAGIASRPLMADWKDISFDHSTEVWLNNNWRVYRGYNTFEMGDEPNDSPTGCSSGWPKCGSVKNQSRSAWGAHGNYKPWHSGGGGGASVIVLAGDNWTETGTAYRWGSWDVGEIRLDPTRLNTVFSIYWGRYGWNKEPTNLGKPGWPPRPGSALAGLAAMSPESNSLDVQSAKVQLGNVVKEYTVDSNGNGQYDQLVLEVEVTAAQPGRYWLLSQLRATRSNPTLTAAGGILSEALVNPELAAGKQIVPLVFSGKDIALNHTDGPYQLSGLWITDAANPEPSAFASDSLAQRVNFYSTANYAAVAFETDGALLSNEYSHSEMDSNGDGRADGLIIKTGLKIYQPGEYSVEGGLYDGQDKLVGRASWQGSGSEVSLEFSDMAGRVGPYHLKEVRLLDGAGEAIDESYQAYTVDSIAALAAPAATSFNLDTASGGLTAFGATITPTQVFNTQLVNGNLQLNAGVTVAIAGSYKLEAWLADSKGNLVTWAVGQPTLLNPGLQTLSATFAGSNIRAKGVAGPYTVVAVKILAGDVSYQVLDSVNVAVTTPAYSLNSFTQPLNIAFTDYVENGAGQWTADPAWTIVQEPHQFFSPSPAWTGADADAILQLKTSPNLSKIGKVGLKFQTSYSFSKNSAGYVEVSRDGGASWQTLATFTGSANWSQQIQVVDLSRDAGSGKPPILIRFRLAAAGGGRWYLDDFVIGGTPDTDGDGIPDKDEGQYGTNPADSDSDNDGLPDGWEVFNNLDPLNPNGDNSGIGDPDHDGLNNIGEYVAGTDPHNPDSDGDGLPDGWEVHNGLDPNDGTGDNGAKGDPDGDGLTNKQEYEKGTNPRNPDTDNDGIPDPQDDRIEFRVPLPLIFK